MLVPDCPLDHSVVQPEQILVAVRVTFCPGHSEVEPLAEMDGATGTVPAVTVTLLELGPVPQPLLKEAVYEPADETVMLVPD